MSDIVFHPIEACDLCPAMKLKRHHTGDSFEMVFDWQCSLAGMGVIASVEAFDPKPKIPEWCPLRAVKP